MKKLLLIVLFLIPSVSLASFDVNLKYGASGADVSQLQELLSSEGCLTVTPTGYFGLLTLAGVQCFQTKYSISPVSGYFGVLSRTQANSIVANAIVNSDQAEVVETGNTATPCIPGQLFNIVTGASCSEAAQATSDIKNKVEDLQNTIDSLNQKIDRIENNTTPNLGGVNPAPITPEPILTHKVTFNAGERYHDYDFVGFKIQILGFKETDIFSIRILDRSGKLVSQDEPNSSFGEDTEIECNDSNENCSTMLFYSIPIPPLESTTDRRGIYFPVEITINGETHTARLGMTNNSYDPEDFGVKIGLGKLTGEPVILNVK